MITEANNFRKSEKIMFYKCVKTDIKILMSLANNIFQKYSNMSFTKNLELNVKTSNTFIISELKTFSHKLENVK